MSSRLPASPSLEQLQQPAKELLRDVRAGDPAATRRGRARHPLRATARAVRRAARVAREHGFPSWPRLGAYVERVAAHGPGLQHAYHEDLDYYEERASTACSPPPRTPPASAMAAFARWDAPLTRRGARASWPASTGSRAGRRCAATSRSLRECGEPFARAYRAVEAHDLTAAGALLDRFPELVAGAARTATTCSAWPAATCDGATVALLLERGADPARANAHGWTPLHQAATAAGRPRAAAARRRRARRRLRARRRRHAARRRAVLGPPVTRRAARPDRGRPGNLRVAAGLGRRRHDRRPGRAADARSRGRRPPRLLPPARRLPGVEAVRRPAGGARRGAVVGRAQRPRRGARRCSWRAARASTPTSTAARRSLWAAASRRARGRSARCWRSAPTRAAARRSAARTHGEGVTPLHLAAQGGSVDAIERAARGGADPTLRDGLYGGTPADWAEHGGDKAAQELLAKRRR